MEFRKYFDWLFLKRKVYTPLDDSVYYKRFGIEKDINGKYEIKNKELLEKAYERAWKNRDFEIDKFWTRAAYFWGFIVLIFGGYITLLTAERPQKALKMHLDLYLILLGFLFSIAWFLVILGSKSWQRNWETHIDWLEDYVSGPIYKTIHYGTYKYYSVSKLNQVMAFVVILVWFGLFTQYLIEHYKFTISRNIDIASTLAIFGTFVIAIVLIFGYSSSPYKSSTQGFIDRWA